jgi:hypothetical protein
VELSGMEEFAGMEGTAVEGGLAGIGTSVEGWLCGLSSSIGL